MLRWLASVFTAILLCSCQSATENIAQSASEIGGLAASSKSRFETIADTTNANDVSQKNIREINATAEVGIGEQLDIIDHVGQVHSNLTRTTDIQPWWATMLGKLATAAAIIGVAFLLWQTGVGYVIKGIAYSFGWLIPSNVKNAAELDAKNLDNDNPATLRESIAAKRASDPAYKAAWKRERRKSK